MTKKLRTWWQIFKGYPRRLQVFLVLLAVAWATGGASIYDGAPEVLGIVGGGLIFILVVWLAIEGARKWILSRRG